MNSQPNIYLYPCCICEVSFPNNFVLQLPCCSPSPFFCYECSFRNMGMNCVICGQFYGVERIKALVKNNQIKQHNRNRSDIGPNINNKLSFQTGFNKSHNAEMENVPTGGAFVTQDVLEFFKKSFHGNHTKYQERSNSHINFQNKQNFFEQNNISKESFFSQNSTFDNSTRPSFFHDEVNEKNFDLNFTHNQYNMMNSIVTRNSSFNSPPYSFNSKPNGNFQNIENLNSNQDLNFLASAPERLKNNNPNYYNNFTAPQEKVFTNFNNYQQQDSFNQNINARFNNHMDEAEYFQQNDNALMNLTANNPNAMAIEPDSLCDIFNTMNLNSGQNQNQNVEPPAQIQQQSIHINNLNIQNAAMNSQLAYVPQTISLSTPNNQCKSPRNFFFQNTPENNNSFKNSHKFGLASNFPDNRHNSRKSVSPIRSTLRYSENFSQITPKANQKIQENVERLENLGTKKKPLNYNDFFNRNSDKFKGNF